MDLSHYKEELNDNGVVALRSVYNEQDMSMIKAAIDAAVNKPSPFKSSTNTENGSFYMDLQTGEE